MSAVLLQVSLSALLGATLLPGNGALQLSTDTEPRHLRNQLGIIQKDKVVSTSVRSQVQTGNLEEHSRNNVTGSLATTGAHKTRLGLGHLIPSKAAPTDRIYREIGEYIGNRTKLLFAVRSHNVSSELRHSHDKYEILLDIADIAQDQMPDWLEYELQLVTGKATVVEVNKFQLALVNMVGFGLCGIDRCLVGQYCLGCVKFITLGAFGLWTMMDALVIIGNCFTLQDSISTFGFHATFSPWSTIPALVITVIMLCFTAAVSCLWLQAIYDASKRPSFIQIMAKV